MKTLKALDGERQMQNDNDDKQINVNVKIPGAVLPGWAVIILILCLVFSGTGLLLVVFRLNDLDDKVERLENELSNKQKTVNSIERWIIAVYERGSAYNWKLPKLPKEINDGTEEEALQSAGRASSNER